ncbi:MAG: membrane-bound lytic murein transglycosylase B [Planctomycetota bacterium]|jgi:membrane-bound lytic murein transglycosylase B
MPSMCNQHNALKNLFSVAIIVSILVGVCAFFISPSNAQAQVSTEERKVLLEQELAELEKEIKEQEIVLSQQKNQTGTINRDIGVLTTEIKQKKLVIQQKQRLIRDLGDDILDKSHKIVTLDKELTREMSSLARILRKVYEVEQNTLAEFLLDQKRISEYTNDFFVALNIQESLQESFNSIRNIQVQTETEKKQLEKKQVEEADTQYKLEAEKKKVEQKQDEKEVLLKESKKKEKTYEQVLTERRARAAGIRAALFELRGQQGISFGDAYEFAKVASSQTGVRPAYILAILKQESNIGKNVGTCNRIGDTRTWRDIMPGPTSGSWRDDQTEYLEIMEELGLEPYGQPLSCPLSSGGWGGAMGPSQFIPVTWNSYKARVAQKHGIVLANPWNPAHAIMATALYVKDLGADQQTFTTERNAACKYYSGRGCDDPRVKNLFYGNGVMKHAQALQLNIDILEGL